MCVRIHIHKYIRTVLCPDSVDGKQNMMKKLKPKRQIVQVDPDNKLLYKPAIAIDFQGLHVEKKFVVKEISLVFGKNNFTTFWVHYWPSLLHKNHKSYYFYHGIHGNHGVCFKYVKNYLRKVLESHCIVVKENWKKQWLELFLTHGHVTSIDDIIDDNDRDTMISITKKYGDERKCEFTRLEKNFHYICAQQNAIALYNYMQLV